MFGRGKHPLLFYFLLLRAVQPQRPGTCCCLKLLASPFPFFQQSLHCDDRSHFKLKAWLGLVSPSPRESLYAGEGKTSPLETFLGLVLFCLLG